MSSIEETLQRIKSTQGVQGFVIINDRCEILRKSDNMTVDKGKTLGALIMALVHAARCAVRDIEVKNDLQFMRMRSAKMEILVAPSSAFIVIVIQEWKSSDI